MLAASRLPDVAYGDLQAHLSALDLGAARVDALLDEYGADDGRATRSPSCGARASAQIRAEIAALPDGDWSQEDFLDNDGRTDAPLRIACDITKRGETLTLDFSRSAPACAGPVNISRATTVASVYVALKHLFPEVAANSGVLDPITVIVAGELAARRAAAEAGRRLYRNHPAHHRRAVLRLRAHPARARLRQRLRHDQRAQHRRHARGRAALGAVPVLRRRPWRQSGRRRAEPRQSADRDRDHPAGRGDGGGLSRALHAMGAARRIRAARASIAAGSARSTRSSCWRRAPRRSCSPSARASRRKACSAAATARCNVISYEQDGRVGARRRSARRWSACGSSAGSASASKVPAAAAGAIRRGAIRAARVDAATGGWDTRRERAAAGRRRRCRRHLHRSVPVRRGDAARRASARCRARAGRRRTGSPTASPGSRRCAQISAIVHGTTVGTNALLERKGARAGLITTAGFRDVLEMRRRDRRQTWGLTGNFVPVDRRATCASRSPSARWPTARCTRGRSRRGARAPRSGCATRAREALCIVFLHSYANPANERAALEAARERLAERAYRDRQRDPARRSASSSAPARPR